MNVIARRLRWLAEARSSSAAVANTFVSRVFILSLNFATSVLVARSLGPTGRGESAAMALWPTIVCGLISLGIPVALRYEIRQKSHDHAELFSTALIVSGTLGCLAIVIGYFFIPVWLAHYPPGVIRFSQLMMLFAPQIMFQYLSQAYLEARGEFTRSNRMLYLPPLMTVVVLGVLWFARALTPFSVALAYYGPSAVVSIGMAYRLRHSFRFPTQFRLTSKPLFNYGLRAYGLDILGTLSSQVDQALVIHFLSAASFGLYAIALNISRILGIFSTSLNTVLFPKASGLEPRQAVALVGRSARLTLAVTAVAGGLFCLILPVVIPLVYGQAYAQDILLTRILTAEVVIGTTTNVLGQAFMATGRPGLVTVLQTIGLATTVPMLLVLIPRLGLPGAAVALLIAAVLRLALVLACYPTLLHQRVPRLYLNARDVRELRTSVRASH